jgi:hypothetical protein
MDTIDELGMIGRRPLKMHATDDTSRGDGVELLREFRFEPSLLENSLMKDLYKSSTPVS